MEVGEARDTGIASEQRRQGPRGEEARRGGQGDENYFNHLFLPIPIQNFPKNPKNTLIKLCDEAWDTSSGDYAGLPYIWADVLASAGSQTSVFIYSSAK